MLSTVEIWCNYAKASPYGVPILSSSFDGLVGLKVVTSSSIGLGVGEKVYGEQCDDIEYAVAIMHHAFMLHHRIANSN